MSSDGSGDHRRVSRRDFARWLGAAGAAGAVAGSTSWPAGATSLERVFEALPQPAAIGRPNLLVILADDLGWADLSCYGAPVIRTPNLDFLAALGVRFTHGYSASPWCSPTRIGLYTGRYPGRIPGGLREPIGNPFPKDGIPLTHPTLATLLTAQGYSTAMIGKWHCGYLPWYSPTRLGWQEFFGNFSGQIDYFSKVTKMGRYDLFEQEVPHQDLRYYTDVLRERAVEYVNRPHSQPWLLNLNFTTAHSPWEASDDQAVSDDLTARTLAGDTTALHHKDGGSPETYAQMVEELDRAVGDVLRALPDLSNTVVWFASDNGGSRFSNHWPFSGAKGSVLEGGIRVSTMLTWLGRIRGKQVNNRPVTTMDWTATFLELGGAAPHPSYPLDGVSLAGHLLRGEAFPKHDLFCRIRKGRALRRGNLKYVRKADGVDSLFDVVADSRERKNLAASRPGDLASLRSKWETVNSTLFAYP